MPKYQPYEKSAPATTPKERKERIQKKFDEQYADKQPNDIATLNLEHSLRLASLENVDINDAPALAMRIQQYFDICAEENRKPSMSGLALALGISRSTLNDMIERDTRGKYIAAILQKARQIIETTLIGNLQDGKVNPVVGIFLSTNEHGYTNYPKQPLIDARPALGELADPEELAKRIGGTLTED